MTIKNFTYFQRFLLVLSFVFIFSSCSKDKNEEIDSSPIQIRINTPSIGSANEKDLFASTDTKSILEPQKEIIPLENGGYIVAELTPEIKSKTQKLGSTVGIGSSQTLKPDIKYRVIVYTIEGAYITHRDYVAGKESATAELTVSGGRSFYFVSYSINSKTSLPEATGMSNLSTANLENISEDLMYTKERIDITAGEENKISLTLYHKFSLIKTTVQMTEATDNTGKTSAGIYNSNNPIFSNLSASGGVNFATGEATFSPVSINNTKTAKMTVETGGRTTRKIDSEETLLISPLTSSAKIRIPAITLSEGINEFTQGSISLDNIKIVPGHKYNLIMKIYKPDTNLIQPKDSNGNPVSTYFAVGSSSNQSATSKTFTFPAADYGFTFDITLLDNSFQLNVNGTNITSQELEFQGKLDKINVTFEDDTYWEDGSIEDIWKLIGKEENPIIRVVISPTGIVSLFGAKKTGGPLFPLKLRSGTTLNTVTWNTSKDNTVIATQKAISITQMQGYGKGYQLAKP